MTTWHKAPAMFGGDVPRDRQLRFLMGKGNVVVGTWAPYWCGKDCPCGMYDDADDDPECWTCHLPDGTICDDDVLQWAELV